MCARAYTFEIDAWDDGTRDLTLEQEAAYLRVVNAIRRVGGPIPMDYRQLRHLWRCSQRRARNIVSDLEEAGKIEIRDGWIHNPRSMRDLAEEARLRAAAAPKAANPNNIRRKRRGRGVHYGGIGRDKAVATNDHPSAPPQPPPVREKSTTAADAPPPPPNNPQPTPIPEPPPLPHVLRALGIDPAASAPPLSGPFDEQEVRDWQATLGLTPTEIVSVVKDVMKRKRDGELPSSLRYFRGAMEKLATAKAQPKARPEGAGGGQSATNGPARPMPKTVADLTRYQRSCFEEGKPVMLGSEMIRPDDPRFAAWQRALRDAG